jgi:hypothetical protein
MAPPPGPGGAATAAPQNSAKTRLLAHSRRGTTIDNPFVLTVQPFCLGRPFCSDRPFIFNDIL